MSSPVSSVLQLAPILTFHNRSTVQGYARFSPGTAKWTKHTIAEHVSIGGNGPVLVGTPEQVADGLETWVQEADIDGFNFVSASFIKLFHSVFVILCLLTDNTGIHPLPSIIQGHH